MREIKSAYPRNHAVIHYDGPDGFLTHPAIEELKRYQGQAEIRLRHSATLADDAQSLLAAAVASGARITRFEVMEPTLEDIFIEKVQESARREGLPEPVLEPSSTAGAYVNA
jgi:ABC-2 type transport system ATP-binding protein